MIKQVKICSIVLDFALYPRADVDMYNVNRLVESLEAGAEFPPIILDAESLRAVDGFHRTRAYEKVFGPDHEVACELRKYASEKEMILDAIKLNAHHGRAMSSYDRARAMSKALGFGAKHPEIAAAMGIATERLNAIMKDRFSASRGKAGPEALKNTVRNLAGKKLTKAQIEVMPAIGGMNQLYYVNQIHRLIDNEMLDWDNEALIERLAELAEKIQAVGIVREAA